MDKFSYMGNGDVNAIEELFVQYGKDPNSVDKSWQDFFKGFEFAKVDYSSSASGGIPENVNKEFKVIALINGTVNADIFSHIPIRFVSADIINQP